MAQPLVDQAVPPREAIVRVLEQAGIDMVFGIPGGYTGALLPCTTTETRSGRCSSVKRRAPGLWPRPTAA